MKYKKVSYSKLNCRQKEVFNFQKVAELLADYGFNCMKLADDWQGADFLAYHMDGTHTLGVQLKSRLMIAKKYQKRDLHMAFPLNGAWHLIKHGRLVDLVRKHTIWLTSGSWRQRGKYSTSKPNSHLVSALQGQNCDAQ